MRVRAPAPLWVIAGLLMLPVYLRYFAWALGGCGVSFWAPMR